MAKSCRRASCVRHDDDDAYLVVAADKGTATFSDIANEISAAHDFWLGDAFASGGSQGYDHKGMAITARGAWECVERHFREMDVDIQRQPFRVIGVGDMSGDVFGNGMLLSPAIRLVAAFDHRDIFIDPDPDPALGFGERKRLFALPRSSWQDYDRSKISRGGGVFARSAKSIPISPEIGTVLGVNTATLTPNELMHALLISKADLLWFGGIGTYVRATGEPDQEVGDRANDAIRVSAAELGVKVVGEGANLGMTQRARIEFAQRGGRLNTDFIDNSAGVNTSDQEVNIKIALGPASRAGKLSAEARSRLLAAMADDVAAGSLANNYQQSLALSLAERSCGRELPDYALLLHALEERGLFERRLEALPSDKELEERGRAGRGLTRPELAVLLSYAKIALEHDLIASTVPDEPLLEAWLDAYFPGELRGAFPLALPAIACAATSSPPASPMPSSIAAVRRWRSGWPTKRAVRPPMWPWPFWPCARSSSCRRFGNGSMRSMASWRAHTNRPLSADARARKRGHALYAAPRRRGRASATSSRGTGRRWPRLSRFLQACCRRGSARADRTGKPARRWACRRTSRPISPPSMCLSFLGDRRGRARHGEPGAGGGAHLSRVRRPPAHRRP